MQRAEKQVILRAQGWMQLCKAPSCCLTAHHPSPLPPCLNEALLRDQATGWVPSYFSFSAVCWGSRCDGLFQTSVALWIRGRLGSQWVMNRSIYFLFPDLTAGNLSWLKAHVPTPFPPQPAQFVEHEILHLCVFGLSPMQRWIHSLFFCHENQIVSQVCWGEGKTSLLQQGCISWFSETWSLSA